MGAGRPTWSRPVWPPRLITMQNSITLCHLDDIPDGGARGFKPPGLVGKPVIVIRKGGQVHAYRDACPHYDGTPMAWRKDAYLNGDGSYLVCASHGALFEISTGLCILGPCLGDRLEYVAVEISADGDIVI
jgi:nitrite reductase/ring-hydroxylating ferredoxin subunit